MVVRKISGESVELVTINELAELSGKKVITLKKWEEKGWLPCANFRDKPVVTSNGVTIKGKRLYTRKYALMLANEISKAKQGVELEHQVIVNIANVFKLEREEYMKPKTKNK